MVGRVRTVQYQATGRSSISYCTNRLRHFPLCVFPAQLVFVIYPLIPWVGVMAAGYAFGALYQLDAQRRRRILLIMGSVATVLFIILRAINLYGDPSHWSPQSSAVFTVLSFLNTTKYPPSLLFLLMTLGPALFALAWFESSQNASAEPEPWSTVSGWQNSKRLHYVRARAALLLSPAMAHRSLHFGTCAPRRGQTSCVDVWQSARIRESTPGQWLQPGCRLRVLDCGRCPALSAVQVVCRRQAATPRLVVILPVMPNCPPTREVHGNKRRIQVDSTLLLTIPALQPLMTSGYPTLWPPKR